MQSPSHSVLVLYAKLICVPIIWGGTFIAGRIVSVHVPAAPAALLRFLFAIVALLIALHFAGGTKALRSVSKRQWFGTAILGATGILAYNVFFFKALAILPASRTSLIVALNPVITMLLARIFLRERIAAIKWFGMALALSGVWIVITRGDLTQLFRALGEGELLMLGAVSAWAIYTLVGRKLLQGMSPLLSTTCAVLWGCLFLGLLSLPAASTVNASAFTTNVWLSLAFLGVLGTALAFVWYYEGIHKLGAAKTVVFNNLVPIFGVLLAWLILDEPISASLAIGGAIAVTGVFLVNRVR
jgi:drug/metabolite transporter (DMT)-like permease